MHNTDDISVDAHQTSAVPREVGPLCRIVRTRRSARGPGGGAGRTSNLNRSTRQRPVKLAPKNRASSKVGAE